jgi:hypothetical protein
VEAFANKIGRITPQGSFAEFPIPTASSGASGITAGSDGKLYFGELARIGQFTTSGQVTEFPETLGEAQVEGITSGPDGNIWFTEAVGNIIGQLVVTAQPPPPTAQATVSLQSSASQVVQGEPFVFTATVTGTTDLKLPTGDVSFLDGSTLLKTVSLNQADQATFSLSSLSPGTHQITARYGGDDLYPASASLPFKVIVSAPAPAPVVDGPHIVSVERFGIHRQPTRLVLVFNTNLNAETALNLSDYSIIPQGGNRRSNDPRADHIAIDSARYDPATKSVTLIPHVRLKLRRHYVLVVSGTAPNGVEDSSGNLLDGAGNGRSASDFETLVGPLNLAGPERQLVLRDWPSVLSNKPLAAMGNPPGRSGKVSLSSGR